MTFCLPPSTWYLAPFTPLLHNLHPARRAGCVAPDSGVGAPGGRLGFSRVPAHDQHVTEMTFSGRPLLNLRQHNSYRSCCVHPGRTFLYITCSVDNL